MNEPPFVSCVMPTRNRPEFAAQAISCWLRQSYRGNIELVILDDSDEEFQYLPSFPPTPLMPDIHYIWRDPAHYGKMNTGAKRNAVNSLTRGEVIIHWDDDDWNSPYRVQDQINFMAETGKPVVGYHNYHCYRTTDGKSFRYNDPSLRPHSGGSGLAYRKDFWIRHKFEERAVGEDFCFTVSARRNNEMASKDGCGYLVARVHGANSCYPKFGTEKFPEVSTSTLPEDFLLTPSRLARILPV